MHRWQTRWEWYMSIVMARDTLLWCAVINMDYWYGIFLFLSWSLDGEPFEA